MMVSGFLSIHPLYSKMSSSAPAAQGLGGNDKNVCQNASSTYAHWREVQLPHDDDSKPNTGGVTFGRKASRE